MLDTGVLFGDYNLLGGDDTIAIEAYSQNDLNIDGGSGDDTVDLVNSNFIINADWSVGNLLENIENLNFVGTAQDQLSLTLNHVIDVTDEANLLRILGDEDDMVTSIDEGWVQGADQNIDGEDYHAYNAGGATLLIDTDIMQDIS